MPGCDWHKQHGSYNMARSHAKSHDNGHVHVYFNAPAPEELQAEQRRRWRESKAEQRAKKRQPPAGGGGGGSASGGQPGAGAAGKPDLCLSWDGGGGGGAAALEEEKNEGEEEAGPFCLKGEAPAPDGAVLQLSWSVSRAPAGTESAGGHVVLGADVAASSAGAVRTALSWVVGLLQCKCLGNGAAVLWKAEEALGMHISDCDWPVTGDSLGVAAALGLLALALGRQPLPESSRVAVTGALDLTGRVRGVGGLHRKLEACYRAGLRTLLVPESSWSCFDVEEELPGEEREGLRAWAHEAVVPYTTMLEAVHAVLDPGFPAVPLLAGGSLERPQHGYWVGIGCSISYLRSQDRAEATDRPLVVQVASLSRRGRERGAGKGRVVVTGVGGETMEALVLAARMWAIRQREAIIDVLGLRGQGVEGESSGRGVWDWDWAKEDLHVHFASGGKANMVVSTYTAVVAVALASFFTGRRQMEGTAVSGALSPDDRWTCPVLIIGDDVDLDAMELQGFSRLVVTDDATVAEEVLPAMRRRRMQLVVPSVGSSSSSLVAMLTQLLT